VDYAHVAAVVLSVTAPYSEKAVLVFFFTSLPSTFEVDSTFFHPSVRT